MDRCIKRAHGFIYGRVEECWSDQWVTSARNFIPDRQPFDLSTGNVCDERTAPCVFYCPDVKANNSSEHSKVCSFTKRMQTIFTGSHKSMKVERWLIHCADKTQLGEIRKTKNWWWLWLLTTPVTQNIQILWSLLHSDSVHKNQGTHFKKTTATKSKRKSEQKGMWNKSLVLKAYRELQMPKNNTSFEWYT